MIWAATIVPWGLAGLMFLIPRARPLGSRLAPAAALPAAWVGILGRGQSVDLDWLLLGTRLFVDDTAAVFLLLGAVVWTCAALYGRGALANDPARHRFEIFFLATMGAQLGLATAQDAVSFYLLFWVMTLAAYGLVVHDGTPRARRAARVYLVMAILGEGLLLPGILFAASAVGSTDLAEISRAIASARERDTLIGLFLVGFAVKAGAPPLHLWLPLAHPAAPVPASAILSGLLINAGLLGWLRFLPLGQVDLPEWGGSLVTLGIAAALLGAAIGTTQKDPKSVLAYSSISQMGWMTLIVGLGLSASSAWEELLPVLLFFVVHHGLAKSALFLGVGVAHSATLPRIVVVAGLVLPALSLAGAPFTSGALVKPTIKSLLRVAPDPLPLLLPVALFIATVGTALVLARAIILLLPRDATLEPDRERPTASQTISWAGLVLASALLPAFWMLGAVDMTTGVLPIGLAIFAIWAWNRLHWPLPTIPPGDILVGFDLVARSIRRVKRPQCRTLLERRPFEVCVEHLLERAEVNLGNASSLVILFVGLLAVFAAASFIVS